MTIHKKTVTVNGLGVSLTENPGAPLLLLVRMAARGMGLWDKVWGHLGQYYAVANFDLPTSDMDKFDSTISLFKHFARMMVDTAKGLGYDRFHLFGWAGGARVAVRCLVDFPEHLQSCILMGIPDRPRDVRAGQKNMEVINLILEHGNLELYTYNWLLSGFSTEYALDHFDDIRSLVDARMEADKGRLDARGVQKWIRIMSQRPARDEELQTVQVPTLLIAPNPIANQRLHSLIRTSELAVIPGSRQFLMIEDPEALIAAAGPFLRAASRGISPLGKLACQDDSALMKLRDTKRVQVLVKQPEEAIVFLHGWLMSPEMWAHPISALFSRIKCIALWQPGHGMTAAPRARFTMDNWVEWLMEIFHSLNVKRAILVGHSMGGMLSLATTLKYPERVKGLVLVDTQDTSWDKERNNQWLQTVGTIAASWGPGIAPRIASFLLGEQFIKNQRKWLESWVSEVAKYDLKGQVNLGLTIAERPDMSARLKDITVPALVVHGTLDQAISPETARAMASRIPDADFEEIAGAGHCPPLEMPKVFTNRLVSFLKRRGLLN